MKRFVIGISISLVGTLLSCDEEAPEGTTRVDGKIETLAGGPGNVGYSGDNGPASEAKLGWVTGVCLDKEGNLYFSDGAANVIRRIARADRIITTVAGKFYGFNSNDPSSQLGDGGLAMLAHFNIPMSITADAEANLFISDAGNHAIRFVENTSGIISTLAGGKGLLGYDGDGGPATEAKLWNPHSVAINSDGDVLIADKQNSCIRKISNNTAFIETIAGMGPDFPGYSGDNGPATGAKLGEPVFIAVGGNGDFYISDNAHHVVRKVSGGIITTVAGSGTPGYTGDNGPATAAALSSPAGLALDAYGNLFIADSGNNAIRMVSASTGEIQTIAGTGSAGYSGDGASPSNAQLSAPLAVAVDEDGVVYIADTGNSAIRIVTP